MGCDRQVRAVERGRGGARSSVGGLVLGAGGATRFGGPKQLADLDGKPLLEHSLEVASRAPLDELVVVLGAHAREVKAAIDLHGATPVHCDRWREGIAASLRAGVDFLRFFEAVVILLGDQPFVTPAAVERVIAAWTPPTQAVQATYDGEPGHPVLLSRAIFPIVGRLRGDGGARTILASVRTAEVACEGVADPRDIDTRADLAAISS